MLAWSTPSRQQIFFRGPRTERGVREAGDSLSPLSTPGIPTQTRALSQPGGLWGALVLRRDCGPVGDQRAQMPEQAPSTLRNLTSRGSGVKGRNWEIGIDTCVLLMPCIKQMTNENLLDSTGSST